MSQVFKLNPIRAAAGGGQADPRKTTDISPRKTGRPVLYNPTSRDLESNQNFGIIIYYVGSL